MMRLPSSGSVCPVDNGQDIEKWTTSIWFTSIPLTSHCFAYPAGRIFTWLTSVGRGLQYPDMMT
jgi:hypothetical protein